MPLDTDAINALLPDNTTGEISPSDVRDCYGIVAETVSDLETQDGFADGRLTNLESRASALEADVAALTARVDALEATAADHEIRIAELETRGTIISGWWVYQTPETPPPAEGALRITTTGDGSVGTQFTLYLSPTDDDGILWTLTGDTVGQPTAFRSVGGTVVKATIDSFIDQGTYGEYVLTITENNLNALQNNERVQVSVLV